MLVFVHINKTAGSTMRYILRSSYGAGHCEVEPWHHPWKGPLFSNDDLAKVRKIYPELASIASHRIGGSVDLEQRGRDLTYFTFLRDPLKTTASRFQYHVDHRKKQGLVFEEWIQQDWLRNAQTQRIAGVADASAAIQVIEEKAMFVGLAERFDESVIMLQALRAGDLDISYRRVNVARRNTLAADLLSGERSRRLLAEANEQDLELYAYAKEEFYPRLRREYGSTLDDAVAEYQRSPKRDFNRRNLVLYRLRQHGVYKPLLALSRVPRTQGVVERFLG